MIKITNKLAVMKMPIYYMMLGQKVMDFVLARKIYLLDPIYM